LQRSEGALAPTSGFRRVRRDVPDAELFECPADLVSWVLETLPPASGVKK